MQPFILQQVGLKKAMALDYTLTDLSVGEFYKLACGFFINHPHSTIIDFNHSFNTLVPEELIDRIVMPDACNISAPNCQCRTCLNNHYREMATLEIMYALLEGFTLNNDLIMAYRAGLVCKFTIMDNCNLLVTPIRPNDQISDIAYLNRVPLYEINRTIPRYR